MPILLRFYLLQDKNSEKVYAIYPIITKAFIQVSAVAVGILRYDSDNQKFQIVQKSLGCESDMKLGLISLTGLEDQLLVLLTIYQDVSCFFKKISFNQFQTF